MMGKKAIEAARVFVEETGISDSLTAEDFLIEREAMLQDMFPTSELMPGITYRNDHLYVPIFTIVFHLSTSLAFLLRSSMQFIMFQFSFKFNSSLIFIS